MKRERKIVRGTCVEPFKTGFRRGTFNASRSQFWFYALHEDGSTADFVPVRVSRIVEALEVLGIKVTPPRKAGK